MVNADTSILLIHTDPEVSEALAGTASQGGFCVRHSASPLHGLALALRLNFAVVILHLHLPGVSSLELVHQIRRRSPVPILCIARQAAQGIAALNAGADDYILENSFEPEDLLARLRAILRRVRRSALCAGELHIGGLRINSGTRSVLCRGELVRLTSMEFDLLELLTRSAGRIVSRDEIATILNQRAATPFERAIDVHVSRLRKKLNTSLIRSIRGVGYLFQPTLQVTGNRPDLTHPEIENPAEAVAPHAAYETAYEITYETAYENLLPVPLLSFSSSTA